jgi:hypothetical protein
MAKTWKQTLDIAAAKVPSLNGTEFWKWYGFKSRVAWCACFVSWVLNKAGLLKQIGGKQCSCPQIMKLAKANKVWRPGVSGIKAGAVVLFDWDNDGVADHVGFYVKTNSDKSLRTIEGNTSNVVSYRNRIRGYIVGHINIEYKAEKPKPVAPAPAKPVTPKPTAPTPKPAAPKPAAKPKPKKKSATTIAKEVIAGKWGVGDTRKKKLKAAGYNPQAIQSKVNKLLRKK